MDNGTKSEKATITTKKLALSRDTVRVLKVKTDVRAGLSNPCLAGGSGIASGGGGISQTNTCGGLLLTAGATVFGGFSG